MAYIGRDIQYGTFTTKQTLTADSSTTVFTLTQGVADANNLLVSIGGIVQEANTAYTAVGTVLTFASAPVTGDPVWVVYLGKEASSAGASRDSITYQTGVGDGTTTPFALSSSVTTSSSIIVTLNGVEQVPGTDFTAYGTVLTFTTAPESAEAILIYYIASLAVEIATPANTSITTAKLSGTFSGTLPAWNGAALTGLLSKTLLDEINTNIALVAFLRSTDHNKSVLNMMDAFIDQFEDQTGVDDTNSTYETYDATNDYYVPSAASVLPMTSFAGGGNNDMKISNASLGITDGKEVTVAFWVKEPAAEQSNERYVFGSINGADGNNVGFPNGHSGNGQVGFFFRNSSNTTVCHIRSTTNVPADTTTHVVMSINSATSSIHIAINGVLETTLITTTAISANAIFRLAVPGTNPFRIASKGTSNGEYGAGQYGQMFYDTKYYDLTNSATLAKFYSGGSVDMGSDGTGTGLTQPLIYLNNAFGSFQNNGGSGGNFTVGGTLTAGDDLVLTRNNMTLISESKTADASPDTARVSLFNQEVDALTVNTDIMAWASRSKQTVTATNATNVLNATAHGLSNNDRVMIASTYVDAGIKTSTMTALTSPSGTASASNSDNGPAYHAFALSSTPWATGSGQTTGYLQYAFNNGLSAFTINRYSVEAQTSPSNNRTPKNWTIKASNTGAFGGEEVTLDTRTGITYTTNEVKEFTFTNTTAYVYYRMDVTAVDSGGLLISVVEWKLYSSAYSTLPVGLSDGTVYHVVNKTTNTFQVSLTSGGAAVTFSDDGTGTHTSYAVTLATLVDGGDYGTGKATLTGTADISGQPTGTDMSLIVQTKNTKETKLHGMALQYR